MMRSTVTKAGVLYEVVDEDAVVWTKWVEFNQKKENRPGGWNFRAAAKEQEGVALQFQAIKRERHEGPI